MWTDLRKDIERVRRDFHLPPEDFSALPHTTSWQQLEERIYQAFCVLDHPTSRPLWLWERFKSKAYSMVFEDDPITAMTALLENDELVWLMVNEPVLGQEKFWFYQGKRAAIYTVLSESFYLDEIYLISKKYEWLVCLNHHDALYGVGSSIINKMKAHTEGL